MYDSQSGWVYIVSPSFLSYSTWRIQDREVERTSDSVTHHMVLPECCASGWLGVSGEIAGVSGVMAAAGILGGVRRSGFVFGVVGGASLRGFWLVGREGISVGSGSSRSFTDSDAAGTLGFPPRATGGGISSSLTGFPFLTDVNMDCNV